MQPDEASCGPEAGPPLTVGVHRDGDATIVLAGEFDLHGTEAFARAVDEALVDGPEVLEVDARGVRFMDSSGLKSLLEARTSAAAAGSDLAVRHASDAVRRVIVLAGLDTLLLR
jgi:anti-anti-sigma factor